MKLVTIDVDRLREVFAIDDEGRIFWQIKTCKKTVVGRQAGSRDKHGYLVVTVDKKEMKVHRIVWAMTHGRWPEESIDHINMVKDDNRPCNLREASYSQNHFNRRPYSNNTSGYKGVSFRKDTGKWTARITAHGKTLRLGNFNSPEEAHAAYCAAVGVHGEYARVA